MKYHKSPTITDNEDPLLEIACNGIVPDLQLQRIDFVCRDFNLKGYYCHQLRQNFVTYPFIYPDDRCFLLAAYSLIADGYMEGDSIDARGLFPAWVCQTPSDYNRRAISAHNWFEMNW